MRLLLFTIAVCYFSCVEMAPTDKKSNSLINKTDKGTVKIMDKTDNVKGKITASLRLMESQALPPGCGVLAIALAQKFYVIAEDGSLGAEQIIVNVPCPELYGKDFFKKGRLYTVVLTRENQALFKYMVVSNYKNSSLKTYWAEDMQVSY